MKNKKKEKNENIEIEEISETKESEKNDSKKVDETPEEKKKSEKELLEEKISKLENEKKAFKEKYLGTLAEFENFRKRNKKQKVDWIKNATQQLVVKLCDINDNFQRAIDSGVEEHQFESILDGVKMIHQQLEKVLSDEGVKVIDALGKEFDPKFHQALSRIPSDEYKEDKVAAIIQNGFTMNGKVVREVKVAVSTGAAKKEESKENKNPKKDKKK